MKGSVDVELMTPVGLTFYARTCGWTLARAHARSGDPVAIAAYLGDSDALRQVDHRLLRALRRPERAGLPAVRRTRSDPDGWKRSRASDDPVGLAAGRRRGEEGALSSSSTAILVPLPGASDGASSAGAAWWSYMTEPTC